MLGVRLGEDRFSPQQLQQLASALLERGVHVSIRGTAVRIAPHVWNTVQDIDQLFDALAELLAATDATVDGAGKGGMAVPSKL